MMKTYYGKSANNRRAFRVGDIVTIERAPGVFQSLRSVHWTPSFKREDQVFVGAEIVDAGDGPPGKNDGCAREMMLYVRVWFRGFCAR